MSGALLSGRIVRPRVVTTKTADDVHPSTRTDAEVRAEILVALGPGPRLKWQLREQLHETEDRIARMLVQLREQGLVRWHGHRRQAKYSLIDWVPDDTVSKAGGTGTTTVIPPKNPPSDSWWVTSDDEEFVRRHRQELGRIIASPMAATVKAITLANVKL